MIHLLTLHIHMQMYVGDLGLALPPPANFTLAALDVFLEVSARPDGSVRPEG